MQTGLWYAYEFMLCVNLFIYFCTRFVRATRSISVVASYLDLINIHSQFHLRNLLRRRSRKHLLEEGAKWASVHD